MKKTLLISASLFLFFCSYSSLFAQDASSEVTYEVRKFMGEEEVKVPVFQNADLNEFVNLYFDYFEKIITAQKNGETEKIEELEESDELDDEKYDVAMESMTPEEEEAFSEFMTALPEKMDAYFENPESEDEE